MSYEHRGCVIGIKQKLLYVLPIFSYDPAKHPDVYHHIDNPASKSDMFLLKASEFSFINHDSVLKLNDIRTVSINRILYQQNGMIPPVSDTYKQIEQLVQRILSNWQFDLPIFLIALFPKPRRSHRYACVWEASLSEKYSASNYPKLNFRCTSFTKILFKFLL